jgi:TonB family protein
MEMSPDDRWRDIPEIYDSKDVTVQPVIVKNVPVIYPNDAIEKKLSGKVVIKVIVDERGRVVDAEIHKGLYDTVEMSLDRDGNSDVIVKRSDRTSSLDKAALEAAKKTEFRPATIQMRPVKATMYIPYTFVDK